MRPLVLRGVLASLPLLGGATHGEAGLALGGVGAGLSLATVFIFLVLRQILPRVIHRVIYVLLLLGFVTLATRVFTSPFLLVLSVLLLTPPEIFQKRRTWQAVARETAWACFAFFFFLSAQGGLGEGMRGLNFFSLPVGGYFLAGLFVIAFPSVKRGPG